MAPDVYCLLLENYKVRVLELLLKRCKKMAMYSHPAVVAYAFENAENK